MLSLCPSIVTNLSEKRQNIKMTNYELGKETYKVITGDMVNVSITSNITSFTSEKRFDKSITVTELRSKLELICGASAGAMTITVFDKDDKNVCTLQVSKHGGFMCHTLTSVLISESTIVSSGGLGSPGLLPGG